MTRKHILFGIGEKENLATTDPIARLAWYKDRMEKLEAMKETKQVKVSKALCLDRIRRIARQLGEEKQEPEKGA